MAFLQIISVTVMVLVMVVDFDPLTMVVIAGLPGTGPPVIMEPNGL